MCRRACRRPSARRWRANARRRRAGRARPSSTPTAGCRPRRAGTRPGRSSPRTRCTTPCREDRRVTQLPDWLSSTLAADGAAGRGALPPWIHALSPDATVAGTALVVTVGRDDNSPMRDVPGRVAAPGMVLVVGGAGESTTAILGDLVAAELLHAGIVAVVTDGLIRDSRAVAEAGLPVWARGTTPVASRKDGIGRVGGDLVIGGVPVADGDVVVADADGVVVWPAGDAAAFLSRADEKRIADEKRAAAASGR